MTIDLPDHIESSGGAHRQLLFDLARDLIAAGFTLHAPESALGGIDLAAVDVPASGVLVTWALHEVGRDADWSADLQEQMNTELSEVLRAMDWPVEDLHDALGRHTALVPAGAQKLL